MSRPNEGAAGKTGTWRVFKPVVDREKCNACGLCAIYCPDAVIDEDLEIDLILQRLRHLCQRMPEESNRDGAGREIISFRSCSVQPPVFIITFFSHR